MPGKNRASSDIAVSKLSRQHALRHHDWMWAQRDVPALKAADLDHRKALAAAEGRRARLDAEDRRWKQVDLLELAKLARAKQLGATPATAGSWRTWRRQLTAYADDTTLTLGVQPSCVSPPPPPPRERASSRAGLARAGGSRVSRARAARSPGRARPPPPRRARRSLDGAQADHHHHGQLPPWTAHRTKARLQQPRGYYEKLFVETRGLRRVRSRARGRSPPSPTRATRAAARPRCGSAR